MLHISVAPRRAAMISDVGVCYVRYILMPKVALELHLESVQAFSMCFYDT